jgi:RNA polymerase sigma factor (sigma-70 family)
VAILNFSVAGTDSEAISWINRAVAGNYKVEAHGPVARSRMFHKPMSKVVQGLRSAALAGDEARWTDAQLLDRFVAARDAAALETLVSRYAPMVWGVCCRILRHHHDAEDAFQATFLVLVRKAASVAPRALVGNWLYGVANQTALKARAMRARRQMREAPRPDPPEPMALDPDPGDDARPLLDQELNRLPARYRAVLVLCDLQGASLKEAARQLGVPPGTVASRRARGRALLGRRLTRTLGFSSAGALLAAAGTKAAPPPAALLSATTRCLTQAAAGQALAGTPVSAGVLALTQGVLRAMLLTKIMIQLALFLAAGAVILACGVLAAGPLVGTGSGSVPGAEPGAPESPGTRGGDGKAAGQAKGPAPGKAKAQPPLAGWIGVFPTVPNYHCEFQQPVVNKDKTAYRQSVKYSWMGNDYRVAIATLARDPQFKTAHSADTLAKAGFKQIKVGTQDAWLLPGVGKDDQGVEKFDKIILPLGAETAILVEGVGVAHKAFPTELAGNFDPKKVEEALRQPPRTDFSRTLDAFKVLRTDMSYADILDWLGPPDRDIGSGVLLLEYDLPDKSYVQVGFVDKQIFVKHVQGGKTTNLVK